MWMSVHRASCSSRIGVAYYSVIDEVLYAGEFSSIEAVQPLKLKLRPDLLLTSCSQPTQLIDLLIRNDAAPGEPFVLKQLPRSDFSPETAMQRLKLLQVEELTKASQLIKPNRYQQTSLLRTTLDFQQTAMLSAIGGLLQHLLQSGVVNQLEHDRSQPISVRAVRGIPSDTMHVDLATLEALSIFVREAHPGSGMRSKEGFSVYSMLNYCKTALGSHLLRSWLREPTCDFDIIRFRQDHIQYFADAEHQELTDSLQRNLSKVKNIARLVKRFNAKPPPLQDWQAFYQVRFYHFTC
jgi:DNA mismatch repair ATPase MutS